MICQHKGQQKSPGVLPYFLNQAISTRTQNTQTLHVTYQLFVVSHFCRSDHTHGKPCNYQQSKEEKGRATSVPEVRLSNKHFYWLRYFGFATWRGLMDTRPTGFSLGCFACIWAITKCLASLAMINFEFLIPCKDGCKTCSACAGTLLQRKRKWMRILGKFSAPLDIFLLATISTKQISF